MFTLIELINKCKTYLKPRQLSKKTINRYIDEHLKVVDKMEQEPVYGIRLKAIHFEETSQQ